MYLYGALLTGKAFSKVLYSSYTYNEILVSYNNIFLKGVFLSLS